MKVNPILVFALALVLLAASSCKKKKTDAPVGSAPKDFSISTAFNTLTYTSAIAGSGSF